VFYRIDGIVIIIVKCKPKTATRKRRAFVYSLALHVFRGVVKYNALRTRALN